MNETVIANGAASTKDRILDAAERLLAKNGFEATSLRAITSEAEVNLAAVNYHFQSKDALIRAVIARRVGPVNQKRLAMLDAVEAAAGSGRLPLAPVIEAFVGPVIELRSRARLIAPLLGRIFSENEEFLEHFFREHFTVVLERFLAAFERSLPELSREEVLWRLHFLIGSMSHTMIAGSLLQVISGGLCRADDAANVIRRMVGAFTAVFEAAPLEKQDAN